MNLFRDRNAPQPGQPLGETERVPVAPLGRADGEDLGEPEGGTSVQTNVVDAEAAVVDQMSAVSPAAAAATTEALARAAQAMAFANRNYGDVNAIKIVNNLQETLEQRQADDEYLEAVLALFAPPDGFEQVVGSWLDSHLVVVAPGPDSGRFITAHALLATIRRRRGVDVGALPFGGGGLFPSERLPPDENWAYLVEVPAEEADLKLDSTFGSSLRSLQQKLKDRRCWMILLMSPEQWNRAEAQAPSDIKMPAGEAVARNIARRALLVRDPDFPVKEWLDTRRIQALIDGHKPADVQRVVDLIHAAQLTPDTEFDDEEKARKTGGGSAGEELTRGKEWVFVKRVDMVVAACRNWKEQLLDWHREKDRTSFERNFLISAAAQKGAPVAHVYAGASELAKRLGETSENVVTGQGSPGVIELVDAVGADLTDRGTVIFDRVGWDDAALQYFWIDRPLSRTLFLEWLAQTAVKQQKEALEALDETQRRELASRISGLAVDWAVRQNRALPLEKLANNWSEDSILWSEFIEVLDRAAVQPSTARSIHPMLLSWASSSSEADQSRKFAVAEICSRQFGRKQTGKALIRLKHAAKSYDKRVIEAVQAAVRTLWEDTSVRRSLFTAVVSWCEDVKTVEVGRRSFGTLVMAADPDDPRRPWLMTAHQAEGGGPASTETELATGWRCLLAPENSDAELERALSFWLDAGVAVPGYTERIVEVLYQAAQGPEIAGRESPRYRLTGLARQWSKSPAVDPAQRESLYNRINGRLDDDFVRMRAAVESREAL
ncbi:hypothetical protein [Amycolatopsis japonica]